jgi:hypothetical protein
MKHISEIIQLEALVIRIVYVCCVDTNECYETTNPKTISNWNILYHIETNQLLSLLLDTNGLLMDLSIS